MANKGEAKTQLPEDPDYVPIVVELPKIKDSIANYDVKPKFTSTIDYPDFSLGFQHFIHQSKDKMAITEQFADKKRVYLVFNKFERYVDDYDKDVNNVSKQYFGIDPIPNILSRAFFKLWELLFMFDLIPLDTSNFVSAHLAEGPGSFIQATMFYRELYVKKGFSYKNDKYYAVTLHSDEDVAKHIPKMEDKFLKYYEKEKPQRLFIHKTYSKLQSGGDPTKDNGDITDLKTIKLFGGNFKEKKAHFITADGGFDWQNENVQEQEAFKLLLGQITAALNVQAKGGNFVCKFFESFTDTTVKMFSILSSVYEKVYIVKPLMSRKSNSEKYLVCIGFKDNKDVDKITTMLEDVLKDASYQDFKLGGIFPSYKIPTDYKSVVIDINTKIANRQFESINQIVEFIEKQNYRGEEYQERRKMQIDGSNYWINTFYPDVKDFDKEKKNIEKMTLQIANESAASASKLESLLL